jgi:hypothetical protein
MHELVTGLVAVADGDEMLRVRESPADHPQPEPERCRVSVLGAASLCCGSPQQAASDSRLVEAQAENETEDSARQHIVGCSIPAPVLLEERNGTVTRQRRVTQGRSVLPCPLRCTATGFLQTAEQ